MTDKIVTLETRPARTNRHTIDILREALNDAEAGTITECAVAVVYADKSTGYRRSSTESISTMVGSVSIMLHAIIDDSEAE